jgi:hypothetical protein
VDSNIVGLLLLLLLLLRRGTGGDGGELFCDLAIVGR